MLTGELLAKVRKIEIRTRRLVDEITGGAYHSVFKGRGIEFSEVREYTHDDDVRDIDWNVTARMGTPYIKKYAEERELNVMLAVDASASGSFGSTDKEKREQIAEAAALLAFSAIRNNDKVGLLIFTDRTELYLPPRSGRRHALRMIREMELAWVLFTTQISRLVSRPEYIPLAGISVVVWWNFLMISWEISSG